MKSKMDIRKQLESGLAVFLSEGRLINRVPPKGTRIKREPKVRTVEIEVAHLPTALQKKHFSEEV